MSQALTFNGVTLSPITHQNSLWIRAAELARALGYASEKSVSNIYKRNREEFSHDMSVVINLMTTAIPTQTRVFSLRGCHLIAMFSRTPVAKAFRRWVLDVLDKLNEQQVRAATTRPRRKNIADDIVPAPLTPEEARRERYRLFLERVEATRLDVKRQINALRDDAVRTLLPAELWIQDGILDKKDSPLLSALKWVRAWLVEEVTSEWPVRGIVDNDETLLMLLMLGSSRMRSVEDLARNQA